MPIELKEKLGNGDVNGPVSSTDNAVARFDGGGGKTIQDSAIIIEDSGNLDTSGSTLTIGATNATTINIGKSGATINIIGDTTYEQVTNLDVSDKLVTINKGGAAGSGASTGIEIEEDSSVTGYNKTSADRNSWTLKAPNTAGIITLTPGASGFTIDDTIIKTLDTTVVDNTVVRQNGTSGVSHQKSGVVIDDSDNMSGVADLTVTGTTTLATALTGVAKLSSGVVSAGNIDLTSEVTGSLPIANGGTGQTAKTAAFDALSPVTTRGDIIIRDASNNIRLAVGAANNVLKSDGTDPSYGLIANANVDAAAAIAYSKLNLTGSIVDGDLAGSIDAAKIADGSVSNTEFQYINSLSSNVQDQITNHLADTTTHGTTGDIVGTSDTQTLTNKTITGASVQTPSRLDVKQDTEANLTTYAGTASNGQLCFATDTKKMYQVVDSALTEVGAGGAGDKDTIHLIIANDIAIGDIDLTGSNADFDGGGTITASSLTLSTTAADLILDNDESQVIHYDPNADGSNDYFGFTKGIDQGYRGRFIGFSFEYKNDSGGTTNDNDFRFCVKIKDGGNAGDIIYQNMDAYTPTNNNSKSFQTAVYIPSDCTEIEFGWQNTDTTTTVELTVDNILVSAKPYQYADIETTENYMANTHAGYGSTNTAIPYFTNEVLDDTGGIVTIENSTTLGFSITAKVDCSVYVSYTHNSASGGGSIFGFTLNSTEKTTNYSTTTISTRRSGAAGNSSISGENVTPNVTTLVKLSAGDVLRPHTDKETPATAAWDAIVVHATAKKEHVVTAAESESQSIRYDTHAGYGSTNTKIPYFTNQRQDTNKGIVTVGNDSTNGFSITANYDCFVTMSYSKNSSGAENIGISLNSSQLTTNIPSINAADRVAIGRVDGVSFEDSITYSGFISAGDILRPHTNGTGTSAAGECVIAVTAHRANASFLAAIPVQETCYLKDVKASATDGGSSVATTWTTRVLNTVNMDGSTTDDSCPWCSLSSNRFTLAPGTYDVEISSPYYDVVFVTTRLVSDPGGTPVSELIGTSEFNDRAGAGSQITNKSFINGTLAITESTEYEVQYYVGAAIATNGLGIGHSYGSNVYTQVKITKIK